MPNGRFRARSTNVAELATLVPSADACSTFTRPGLRLGDEDVAVRRDAHHARALHVAREHVDLESRRQLQLRIVGLRHDPREFGWPTASKRRRQLRDVDAVHDARRIVLPFRLRAGLTRQQRERRRDRQQDGSQ